MRLTGLQTGLLFLKVFWSHNLQQRVEEGHIGQLTDQNQRLVERQTDREREKSMSAVLLQYIIIPC